MNELSVLTLRNITCIDHAFIDKRGHIIGGSYHGEFFVGGSIEPVENVVVDFSTIKKDIKGLIDDKDIGYDHKLWWIPGFSEGSYVINDNVVTVKTPSLEMTLPVNAFRVFTERTITEDMNLMDIVSLEISEFLDKILQDKRGARVKFWPSEEPFVDRNSTVQMFRYSHGLKKSSSWGCQNIAHGHLSFVEINFSKDAPNWLPASARRILSNFSDALSGCYIAHAENVVFQNEHQLIVAYETERGKFNIAFEKGSETQVILVMESESTIEHIIEFFLRKEADWLTYATKHAEVGVIVSEGLAKGAVKILKKTEG